MFKYKKTTGKIRKTEKKQLIMRQSIFSKSRCIRVDVINIGRIIFGLMWWRLLFQQRRSPHFVGAGNAL